MKFYFVAIFTFAIFLLSNLTPVKVVYAKPIVHKLDADKLVKQLSPQGEETLIELAFYVAYVETQVKEVTPEVEWNVGRIFDEFSGADLKVLGEVAYCYDGIHYVPDVPMCEWFEANKDTISEDELEKQLVEEFIIRLKKEIEN